MRDLDALQASVIGQQIFDLVAGEKTEVALLAVTDALATLIGAAYYLGGGSPEQAQKALDRCTDRLRLHILANWGEIESGRADG